MKALSCSVLEEALPKQLNLAKCLATIYYEIEKLIIQNGWEIKRDWAIYVFCVSFTKTRNTGDEMIKSLG